MALYDFTSLSSLLGLPIWLIIVASVWTLIWKGLALWKSARKHHFIWFVILLIVNTLGILEILYIYLFSEMKLDELDKGKKTKSKTKTKKRVRNSVILR